MAVAVASRSGGSGTHPKPAASNWLGDGDANVMRLIQREKLAKAGK